MKPSTDIPDKLLDNDDSFAHPFFADLKLRPAQDPLVVGGKARNYLFPTLYADVRCAQGIFHCSWKAARDLLAEALGPQALPPRMLGGRSIVAVSCYEYRSVRGVRPYNEVAIALPCRLDGKTGAPVLGAFAGGPSAGYYIAAMPVTSEENRLRGHHYWNLPKITRRIDCDEAEGKTRFTSFSEDGKTEDIALAVPLAGKSKHLSVRSFLATKKDGRILQSPTSFDGDFVINLWPASLFGKTAGEEALRLGRGEAAEVLRRLGAETRPLQTRYAASMNSWFDLPLEGKEER